MWSIAAHLTPTAKFTTTLWTIRPSQWMPNTGKEVWRTQLGDINKGESITMAPLVVKGKVLVGNSGGEFGIRGWFTALDAKTGKIAWSAYTAGPDKDVLIGPEFQAVLSAGSRPGSGSQNLASRCVENWRRRRLGMDFL